MIKINESKHLTKEKQIILGSYYTPQELVNEIHKNINPFISKNKSHNIIFDSSAGCGAFLIEIKKYDYRVADCDKQAIDFLSKKLDSKKIYHSNSLINVSREKYNIPEDSFLIMIGNPPYNDTTSKFKNGEKGKNLCDKDLFDRDLGVSFLKSYNKLQADIICILHPLSYLIKKNNFNRLKDFKNNYKLIKGTIFPSSYFSGTGTTKFPIIIALYKRKTRGMNFEYINNFNFSVLNSNKKLKISNYITTDGYINKYPLRKKDKIKTSPIGLYYYTFRDINSLKRNTSFMNEQKSNSIIITKDNFYKYAYLYSFKKLFQPDNIWIYGNLSPLIDIKMLEKNKKIFVKYALVSNSILLKKDKKTLDSIKKHYKIKEKELNNIDNLEKIINKHLSNLICKPSYSQESQQKNKRRSYIKK